MIDDRSTDPADTRLAALYQAHSAHGEQPAAASDARILALARDAAARPPAKPVAAGWRSWLTASWFGPGLAFATVASLSVVIFSLTPKEDMSVERAITETTDKAPAASVAIPAPARLAESTTASSAMPQSSATQALDGLSRQKVARTTEPAPALPQRSPPSTTLLAPAAPLGAASSPTPAAAPARPAAAAPNTQVGKLVAAPVTPLKPGAAPAAPLTSGAAPASPAAAAPTASVSKLVAQRNENEPAPAPKAEQPNPFPAQSAGMAGGRVNQSAAAQGGAAPPAVPSTVPRYAPAAAADAGIAQRLDKPSLLRDPAEPRTSANQVVPEVRDAVPTYPNEVRPPVTHSYTYKKARDTASGLAAASGSGSVAPRAPPSMRDPAEWIKAIQKLRTEGKSEQVIKELTEFRRQYPLYQLPDELKLLK